MNSTISKIHSILWQFICFAVSIGAFSLILLNRQPGFLREASIASRIDFLPIIPILAILVYICFRIPGRMGELIAFTAIMSLFALPLAGLWASGHTHTTALSGVVPLLDAGSYYMDALRLTSGIPFSDFAARRPLFAGLLSVFLSLTNYNLMVSLAVFTALAGLSSYLAVREIERTYSVEMAVFFLMIVFLFYRLHSGTNMTENLGIALGLLGFAFLWRGATDKKIRQVYLGLFVTTLALNARAGAFFVLPFFIVWAARVFREQKLISWRVLFLGVFFVVLGFALNLSLTRFLAVPSGVPFSNFSYSLYGLAAGGKSWVYIYEAHPEVFRLSGPEQSKRIYQLAFELIRNDPFLTVKGAIFNWRILFSDTTYSIYSYVAHENWAINPLVKWSLYFLSSAGLYVCIRDSKDPVKSLVLAGLTGVFLSIPFAPPIDAIRMRPYAASISIFGILPAIGLAFLLQLTNGRIVGLNREDKSQPIFLIGFTSILILVNLIGPLIIRYTSTKDAIKRSASCPMEDNEIVVRLDDGSFIHLKEKKSDFLDWAPNFHVNTFQKEAHSLSSPDMVAWAQTLSPATTLFLAMDRISFSGVLVVIPSKFLPQIGSYIQLCGRYESSQPLTYYSIFYVKQVQILK